MKLRTKITYVLIIFTIVLIGTIFVLNEYFIMGSYKKMQIQQKDNKVNIVNKSIKDMIYKHESLLLDWAYWDDTFAYINGRNSKFAEKEIVDKIFFNQKINYTLIYNENLELVFEKGFDYINNVQIPISKELSDELKNHINTSGIIEINDEYIIFSSSKIHDSNGNKAGKGLIVFAHKTSNNCAKEISEKSNYDIKIKKISSNVSKPLSEIETKSEYNIFINEKILNTDNYLSFSFSISKDIEKLGISNAYRLQFYTIIAIVLLGMIIRRVILKFIHRLEIISDEISNIRSLSDTNYRISSKGSDELSVLSKSINNMLDKILLMNNKLVESATVDLLTGVYNRRTGLEKLEKTIKIVKRSHDNLTICFIDVNDLKHVNDVFGHRSGDEYLKKITEVIVRNIRDRDFVCRLGGDEFLIVFKSCAKEDAKKVIVRINRDLEKINSQSAYPFSMSISKGIVSYTDGIDIDDFVDMADKRMYIDKTRYKMKKEASEVTSDE